MAKTATKKQKIEMPKSTAQQLGSIVKSSRDIMRKDKGLNGDHSSLLQAARKEEVSINLADKWCLEPEAQQQEYLRLMRIERGIKRKARNLVVKPSRHPLDFTVQWQYFTRPTTKVPASR